MTNSTLQHPTLTHTSAIINLCKPLTCLDITTFSHLRVFNNNQLTVLCNHPSFMMNYLKKKYYNADPCVNLSPETTDIGKYIAWDMVDCHGETADMLADSAAFDFKHIFTIIKNQENYTDYYHFGTHLSNPSIHQMYINHLDLLDTFITYFNSNIRHLPALSRAYDIILNSDQRSFKTKHFNDEYISFNKNKRKIFMDFLQASNKDLLTSKEIDCAKLLLEGKTTKEIANILNFSSRTIEDRINSLKNKLGAKNKFDLLIKLLHMND